MPRTSVRIPILGPRRRVVTGVSAPPAWTPSGSAGLQWWLDAADTDTITKDGSNVVSQWNDKSGNARHALSATGGFQPTWLASGIGGLPALQFIDQRMGTGNNGFVYAGAAMSVLWIGTLISATTTGGRAVSFAATGVTSATAGGWIAMMRTGLTEAVQSQYVSTAYGSQAITYVTPFIFYAARNAATGYTSVNGALTPGSTASANTTAFVAAALGANVTTGGNPGSPYMQGIYGEVLAYNSVIADALRQQCEGYLAWKWGQQTVLPVGHPYKSARPTA